MAIKNSFVYQGVVFDFFNQPHFQILAIVPLMIIHTSLIAKLLLVIINHGLSIKKCFDIDNRHYIKFRNHLKNYG